MEIKLHLFYNGLAIKISCINSPARIPSVVKNLALSLQRQRFGPWPRNFRMLQAWLKKKKKKKVALETTALSWLVNYPLTSKL